MKINLKKIDIVIIILTALILTGIGIFTKIYYFASDKSITIKDNQVNRYESVYITNDKQASIYLNQYYYLLNNDIEKAYELLNDNNTFTNINDFKTYIQSLDLTNTHINRFRFYSQGGNDYYDIYDGNNNNIIFKTAGVMQYSVIINE